MAITSWSKDTLWSLMSGRDAGFWRNGAYYILQSVEREDGSGNSFNIKARRQDGTTHTFYVRTK